MFRIFWKRERNSGAFPKSVLLNSLVGAKKSKSGIVIRDTLYLAMDTFPDGVVKRISITT